MAGDAARTTRPTRIVVTGGSGKLGRAVVRDLDAHGYHVVNIDRSAPPADAPGAWVRIDLTDYGQVVEALSGIDDRYDRIDAVVHLAAIPAPGLIANAQTFAGNVTSTYNVFAAAQAAGITRLVWASSETLLGLPFDDTPPPYFPVDEQYPVRPSSRYSLGKAVDEEVARHFARWNPDNAYLGLRFSNVMDEADYAAFPAFDEDPRQRSWNAWGYIDSRDGAQAVRLALQSDVVGAENFIIAASDTVMSTPSEQLARGVFPGVPFTSPVTGVQTLLSIEKARSVLGFEPRYSWRE